MAHHTDENVAKNDHLEEAVLLIEKAVDAGQKPALQDYQDRYPDLVPELVQYFKNQEELAHYLEPLKSSDQKSTVSWHEDLSSLPAVAGYEILEVIAIGGMGVVCKARHVDMDRLVAIKFIRLERLPDTAARERFQTEARSIAQFDHSNIVRIFDYNSGEEDGCPRIVMEYVASGNLADGWKERSRLRQKAGRETRWKLPTYTPAFWQRRLHYAAASLAAQIADAVEYAHRRGTIHCDLKCANVLLTTSGEPKIADFGLAKRLLPAETLSNNAAFRGTPAFMSPEQAAGDSAAIGPATDVFGLGAILYELLTGRPPFQGQSTGEVIQQARKGIVSPPREINPQVPKALEKICLKALSANQDRRYPSAAVLARDLRRFVAWPRRLAIAAGVVLGILLVAGLWWSGVLDRSGGSNHGNTLKRELQLTGELIVRLWSPDGSEKPGLPITDDGVLPARTHDRVQIETRMNQHAYVYLLWLDSQGNIVPLYPWNYIRIEQERVTAPPEQTPKKEILSPTVDPGQARLKGWPLDENAGLETILFLARREPLPPETDLAKLIGRLPPSPLRNPGEWAMLATYRDWDVEEVMRSGQYRGPEKEAAAVDDPLLQTLTRLRRHFDVVQAVRFAHTGRD